MKLFIKKTLLCATVAMFAGGAYAGIDISGKVSLTYKDTESLTGSPGDTTRTISNNDKAGASAQLHVTHSSDDGKFTSHLAVGTGNRVGDTVYIGDSNNLDDPKIKLKHASLKYTNDIFSVRAGKMKNELFGDMIIDSNYNPDGIDAHLGMFGFNIRSAIWALSDGDKEAYLAGLKASHRLGGFTYSVGYYDVDKPQNVNVFTHARFQPSKPMEPVVLKAKYVKDDFVVEGKYLKNIASNVDNNKGYSLGGSYIMGGLQLKAEYRYLEEHALFDQLTDKDFDYDGYGTGIEGVVLTGKYHFSDKKTRAELKGVVSESLMSSKGHKDKLWMVKTKVTHDF